MNKPRKNQPGRGERTGARDIAGRALERVYTQAAWARSALDAEIARAWARSPSGVDPRDIALATELVYGVLRTEAFLLKALAKHMRPPSSKGIQLAPALKAHLLMGAYSIAFLHKIPVFAAVNEAIDRVRAEGGPGPAAFCNAILRRFSEEIQIHGRPDPAFACAAGVPLWLLQRLIHTLGKDDANAYVTAGPVPPPLGLCLWPGEARDAWLDQLKKDAPVAMIEPCPHSPHGILVAGAGDPRKLKGVGSAWIVQEEGAQLVALSLGAKSGEWVLDACAGHGNKTWLLAHAVGPGGRVDAADLYPAKLRELREGPCGSKVSQVFQVDWEQGAGTVPGEYDRVLLDAPCSGTGTLRRRPEIALHRKPQDIARLSALQAAIFQRTAGRVRPGGRFVYAVCSVLREEAEEVIERAVPRIAGGNKLVSAPFEHPVLAALAGEGKSTLRLLPHVHGTDGYFMASFRVEGP